MRPAMSYQPSVTREHAYESWAAPLARLGRAVRLLAKEAAALGAPVPDNEEWYQLLQHKLLPQVEGPAALVVAVVGGTNIGKSALFNQLAGEAASRAGPLAAGTRHPVCLVPPPLAEPALLSRVFEGFELHAWQSPDDPLADVPEHRLFWRASDRMPPRLLLLDTPDIDSDVQVNWERAKIIRQAADVLIAVLTQQKYNDAAVKQFFRQAAEAGKPVIVVFNQCDLIEDRTYWPQWLETFTSETGAKVEGVYVVPYDRRAAAAMSLPVYDVGRDGTEGGGSTQGASDALASADAVAATASQPQVGPGDPLMLRRHLAELRFGELKRRALGGALRVVLDPATGAPRYLARLRQAAREFESAVQNVSTCKLAKVDWPPVPRQLLVREAIAWWDEHRPPLIRGIHGFYRGLSDKLLWPVRELRGRLGYVPTDPLAAFRGEERGAMLKAVERAMAELERLAEVGNETLRSRLQRLLAGTTRQSLLARLEQDYRAHDPFESDFGRFVRQALEAWKQGRPRWFDVLRYLDRVAAVARPVLSVGLALSGALGAGELIGQAAGHAASHIVVESAAAVATTVGADATITEAAKPALVLLQNLEQGYAEHRAGWLAAWLERHWLGGLFEELNRGANLSRCEAYLQAEDALQCLRAC